MTAVVNVQAAQGDLLITRVDMIPEDLTPLPIKKDGEILAHSETGHHHVMTAVGKVHLYQAPKENGLQMVSFVEVPFSAEAKIEHHRSYDTHAPLVLKQGMYEIRRQREYVPDGWRRVED